MAGDNETLGSGKKNLSGITEKENNKPASKQRCCASHESTRSRPLSTIEGRIPAPSQTDVQGKAFSSDLCELGAMSGLCRPHVCYGGRLMTTQFYLAGLVELSAAAT